MTNLMLFHITHSIFSRYSLLCCNAGSPTILHTISTLYIQGHFTRLTPLLTVQNSMQWPQNKQGKMSIFVAIGNDVWLLLLVLTFIFKFTLAPCCNNISTTFVCPFLDAHISAVWPFCMTKDVYNISTAKWNCYFQEKTVTVGVTCS